MLVALLDILPSNVHLVFKELKKIPSYAKSVCTHETGIHCVCMTDGLEDHVICSASRPAKCELTLPKFEQKQIFMKQTFINVITVCCLTKLAIRGEPWLSWNQWEGSHLLQQISVLLWIHPAIKWILFPLSWLSKWGKKPDYSFSKAPKVPCVLLTVFFCNL